MENTELAVMLGNKIDAGFTAVHEKIDLKVEGLRKELIDHQRTCSDRFQKVETEVRVKTAVAELMRNTEEKEYRDAVWPKVKTALTIAASLALIGAAAKVILAHTGLF